jgi:hypothetical protein
MTESNLEQDVADAEKAFEYSKQNRMKAKNNFDAAKGLYHGTLVIRREAGEKLTTVDMKALEDQAITEVSYVQSAYVEFIASDSDYRAKKIKYNTSVRKYWDNKPGGPK